MSALGFYLARTLRREAPLAALSVPQTVLLDEVKGKRVALVGNARALAKTDFGPEIDAADLVIRINRAPMPAAASHGTRTDWLGLAVRLSDTDRARIGASRYLWMSPKRKRLDYATVTSLGFYLHPLADYAALKAKLDAPPTTGAMLIELLARASLSSLTLYGFDFFASLSLSGRRTAAQVPHDFSSEADWAADLMARDSRITLRK